MQGRDTSPKVKVTEIEIFESDGVANSDMFGTCLMDSTNLFIEFYLHKLPGLRVGR